MKKVRKSARTIETKSPAHAGRRPDRESGAATKDPAGCACAAAEPATAARDGFGPGAHAAGIDSALKAANLRHLTRIEGQVRGIAAMIGDGRYCTDIIQQCAAVQESLRSVAKNLYRNHLSHCALRAMHGNEEQRQQMVEELIELVGKIAR
ncbi:MAG: metal-sensitive transcriptional regulator [Phycisphaerales bacterium]